ncbi:MAG: hypothetical protein ACI8YN_000940 [Porticoccaceae bacterium]|jgi:hypothetical protein
MYRLVLLVLLLPIEFCLAEAESIRFKVFLGKQEIGQHHFTLKQDGGDLHVTSEASMDFNVLLIKKIKYRHFAKEIWKDGCLKSVESTTQRNNKNIKISGKLLAGNFVVTNSGAEEHLKECTKSFAYWRPEWLEDKNLLNVETGKYTPVTLEKKFDPITLMTRRELRLPNTEIRLQYDKSGAWQSLESDLKIAGTLRYQRVYDTSGELNANF